ncbi:transesterase [Xylaria sp. FL1777]|nr:transesterase [Xylaria sp. FL1777]
MQDVERAFELAVQSGQIPGVVVMAKDKTGEKVDYTRCYGSRTARRDVAPAESTSMEADTPMRLASACKIITTVMVMQCVERGLLHLDEDVSNVLPEVGDMMVLEGFDSDSRPRLRKREGTVTLRSILTHSSGISYIVENQDLIRYRDLGHVARPDADTIVDRYGYPLVCDPGRQWCYGPGLEWGGKAVERVTGLSLEEYLQRHICEPLGVTDMTFKLLQRADMQARRADMSRRDAAGVPQNEDASYYRIEPADCFGGMGLFASPRAFMAVLHSLLARDGKLLAAETIDVMFRPQLDAVCEQSLNDEIDARHQTNHGGLLPKTGIRRNHGLGGLMIMENCDGLNWRQKGSMGWGGFPNLYWCVDPEAGVCIVIAFQLIPWADPQCVELGRSFERAVYQQLRKD